MRPHVHQTWDSLVADRILYDDSGYGHSLWILTRRSRGAGYRSKLHRCSFLELFPRMWLREGPCDAILLGQQKCLYNQTVWDHILIF